MPEDGVDRIRQEALIYDLRQYLSVPDTTEFDSPPVESEYEHYVFSEYVLCMDVLL